MLEIYGVGNQDRIYLWGVGVIMSTASNQSNQIQINQIQGTEQRYQLADKRNSVMERIFVYLSTLPRIIWISPSLIKVLTRFESQIWLHSSEVLLPMFLDLSKNKVQHFSFPFFFLWRTEGEKKMKEATQSHLNSPSLRRVQGKTAVGVFEWFLPCTSLEATDSNSPEWIFLENRQTYHKI